MDDHDVARRFWRNRTAVAALGVLGFIALASIFGPFFLPESHAASSAASFLPPSAQHPFGTDLNGRDVLYRVLTGGRVSLLVGLCGALVSSLLGTAYGLIAGYAGGKLDNAMMRIVDILYSVPRLIFILICINAFNAQLQQFASRMEWDWLVGSSRVAILILSLGIIEWLTLARIVRGQVLSLKDRTFVTAAVALGQSHAAILLRHLLPNLVGIIVIYLTLTIPAVIIDESFLSFLGLGVQPPQASWGSLLADGAGSLNPVRIRWWLIVFPAAAMATTLLALNFLGDAMRDILDPRVTRQ
ncbi:MAG TPA: ABC transporter permease [Terrimicrobiaceae bacterium]|nr:ABC transporter permease [Terrimicrobiaceae bacterium]